MHVGERLAADAVERGVDRLGHVVEADDNLGRAELRQALGTRPTPDRGDDVRPGIRGQLHGEAPDAARRAGDQHAAPGDRREPSQRAERGHTGGGERGRGAEVHGVGHDGELGGVDRAPLGPSA